jgi:hypothetical protein
MYLKGRKMPAKKMNELLKNCLLIKREAVFLFPKYELQAGDNGKIN